MALALSDAVACIERGVAKAAELGFRVAIAVVDEGGHLVACHRMDDALWDLYQSGRIAPESAVRYAHDPKAMETRMRPQARRQ